MKNNMKTGIILKLEDGTILPEKLENKLFKYCAKKMSLNMKQFNWMLNNADTKDKKELIVEVITAGMEDIKKWNK